MMLTRTNTIDMAAKSQECRGCAISATQNDRRRLTLIPRTITSIAPSTTRIAAASLESTIRLSTRHFHARHMGGMRLALHGKSHEVRTGVRERSRTCRRTTTGERSLMDSTRILAVDDDANQLAAVRRVLRRSRFEVTTCTNPRRALQLVATEQPDLILLDVSMPTMSGHEFLHRLRCMESARRAEASDMQAKDKPCETPVIFLSGLSESHQKVSGLDAGAEDYITKPFDPDELRARIRNQLRRVRQQREYVAPERAERRQLKATLNQVQETARACEAPLLDLDINLELAGLVRRSGLQKNLLDRAKKDVGLITRSLTRITDGLATKGNH